VFPMVPIRNFLQIPIADADVAKTAANNDGEVVDLDLQFEDNEVMDLWYLDFHLSLQDDDGNYALDRFDLAVGLFEDPDKADTTDLSVENTIENDSSLIYLYQDNKTVRQGATITDCLYRFTDHVMFQFPQPYTVARNVKWILQAIATLTADDFDSIDLTATIWGRRRNASDAEFKNIVYRQRF